MLRYLNYLLLLPLHFLRSMETASGDDQTPAGGGVTSGSVQQILTCLSWHSRHLVVLQYGLEYPQFHVDHSTIGMHSSMNSWQQIFKLIRSSWIFDSAPVDVWVVTMDDFGLMSGFSPLQRRSS